MNKYLLLLSVGLLSGCAVSTYHRVTIPPEEQERENIAPPPSLKHVNWEEIRYGNKTYYAIDKSNMEILDGNLSAMTDYQKTTFDAFQAYQAKHPIKSTKIIRHKNFGNALLQWWLGCDQKEYQDTQVCQKFITPPDYVPPPTPPKLTREQKEQKKAEREAAKKLEKQLREEGKAPASVKTELKTEAPAGFVAPPQLETPTATTTIQSAPVQNLPPAPAAPASNSAPAPLTSASKPAPAQAASKK
ncbi:hypothetical protein FAI41_08190 [Acetobacteraceae bacterium]|nr:hypothetical protein FAI41_08190 [Acetobacteraceae bacterium]